MKLRVRFFASLTDHAGTKVETVELPDDADVGRLWETLAVRYPGLAELGYLPMAVCDLEYAEWDRPLKGVAEVAFLPPVSGG